MPRISLTRTLLLGIVPYMLLFGAMYYALFVPVMTLISLVMLSGAVALWALGYLRSGWRWHPTVLDGVIWLWVAALIIAALANPEHIRRAQTPLWLISALLGGWYVLHNTMTNGVLRRSHIFDVLIIAGIVTMIFVGFELATPGPLRDGFFGLPRLSGHTGNPNLLAALLLPVIAGVFGRAWSVTGIGRIVLSGFGFVLVGVMVLTYSRAGFLGVAAIFGVFLLAYAADRGWLTPRGIRASLRRATSLQRTLVSVLAIGTLVAGIAAVILLVDTLDNPGRTAELRTYLWDIAWAGFLDKPLTGNGLFSTPRLILDASSVPPLAPQTHAHSFPLQVLSEFGIVGGIAMLASVVVILRAGVRAWRSAQTQSERHLIAAGWAGTIGIGVQNLPDMPLWTPFVGLSALLVLLAMTVPPLPIESAPRRQRISLALVGSLLVVILVTGYLGYSVSVRYLDALDTASVRGDVATSIDLLEPLIAQDPSQPVYRWNQGMLYAIQADQLGGPALIGQASARFDEAREYGLDSAVLRFNLAALAATAGDLDATHTHLVRALDFAPDATLLILNYALAAERWGLPDTARLLWTHLLALENIEKSDIALYPAVTGSAVAAEFDLPPLTVVGEIVRLLAAGQAAEALAVLDASDEPPRAVIHALRAIVLFETGGDPLPTLQTARDTVRSLNDWRWYEYARSRIMRQDTPLVALPFPADTLVLVDEEYTSVMLRQHFMANTFARVIVPQAQYERRTPYFAALQP